MRTGKRNKDLPSAEEVAADFLYHKIGTMKLIKDKDGKPIRYEQQYPSIKCLTDICKKEKIKLPEAPKINDILKAMVHAAYTGKQRYASPAMAIKSLADRVLEVAYKDAGVDTRGIVPDGEQKEAEGDKKEAEDHKLKAQEAEVVLKQARAEAEHAKLEAEQAKMEAAAAKIETEQVKLASKQVELQLEHSELLEGDPAANKNKIIKNEAAYTEVEDALAKLDAELANLEAEFGKKKRVPAEKEANKAKK